VPGYQALRRIVSASRDAARQGGLPVGLQLLEMLVLKLVRDIGPNYYHVARFWRRDIAFRDKWRHANDREYARLLFAINPAEYRKASQHKVLERPVPVWHFDSRFVGFSQPTRRSGNWPVAQCC
jgi:hypothetical protein